MDDARRFLRYVIPGLVYAVLTAFCLLIVLPEWTAGKLESLAAKDGLGAALSGFFVSGALGYLFATVHHWWHWKRDVDVLDHTAMVNQLIADEKIPGQPKDKTVDRSGAFESLPRFGTSE